MPAAVFGVHDKSETVRRVDFPVPVKIRNWYGGAIKGDDLIYEEKPEKDTLILLVLICAGSGLIVLRNYGCSCGMGRSIPRFEDANLPVAYVNILGRRMNELDGFVEDSQKAAGRGDLTLLPADRETVGDDRQTGLPDYGDAVWGSQSGRRTSGAERTTLDHWEQSGEEVAAELPIQTF